MSKKIKAKLYVILAELKCKGIQHFSLENALEKVNSLELSIQNKKEMREYLIKNEMFLFSLS